MSLWELPSAEPLNLSFRSLIVKRAALNELSEPWIIQNFFATLLLALVDETPAPRVYVFLLCTLHFIDFSSGAFCPGNFPSKDVSFLGSFFFVLYRLLVFPRSPFGSNFPTVPLIIFPSIFLLGSQHFSFLSLLDFFLFPWFFSFQSSIFWLLPFYF